MTARSQRPPRHGVALPAALGAVALLAALAVGGVAVARDELRASQALAAGVRARAAAESAVAWEAAHWDLSRNVRLAVGAADLTAPPVGADARVRTVRAALRTFLLDGRATVPAGPPGGTRVATRRVRLLLRLRHAAPVLEGAVTVAGALDLAAGALVTGADTPPEGWADCGAWGDVPGPVAAVATSDPGALRPAPGASVLGAVVASARAGLPATYDRLGEETWRSLAARAAVVDGEGPPPPAPLVHARGAELALHGPARGQGLLLVDGDLRVDGAVEWAGLVVVRGALRAGGGALRIRGALMIANADGRGASELGPGSDVAFSSCAVARASVAAARPVPLRRRAWSEVTR